MPEAVHPGSFVGDSIEEFKKLPTWGKFAAVAVVGIVIYLAIRARNAASATNSTGLTGSTTTSGTQSPFPMVGNVPLLPSGVNPLYDNSGNLVGYQQSTPPGQGLVPQPPIQNPPLPPTPAPPSQNPGLLSQLPAGFQDTLGAIFNYNGSQYSIVPGSNGRIWAVQGTGFTNQQLQNIPIGPNPGQKFLLYQGPAQNTQSAMTNNSTGNNTHYTQNATPHLPTPSHNVPGYNGYSPTAGLTAQQAAGLASTEHPMSSAGTGGNRRLS